MLFSFRSSLVAIAVLALAGCGSAGVEAPVKTAPQPTAEPVKEPPKTMPPPAVEQAKSPPAVSPLPPVTQERVTLYFPHETDSLLIKEERLVTRKGEQPERLIVNEVLKGPQSTARKPFSIGDGGFKFYKTKVFDGTLTLMLNREMGHALVKSGRLGIYSLVNSLATIDRVKQVYFVFEGETNPRVVEGIDLSKPIPPRWDLVKQ